MGQNNEVSYVTLAGSASHTHMYTNTTTPPEPPHKRSRVPHMKYFSVGFAKYDNPHSPITCKASQKITHSKTIATFFQEKLFYFTSLHTIPLVIFLKEITLLH